MSDHSSTTKPCSEGLGGKSESARWIAVLWIGIVAAYVLLFLAFFNQVGNNDNDQFLVLHELQFWNFKLFGFPKQWSPVMAGGLSIAADPQVPILSLSMILGYVLGPFYGLRIATILYFVIGWIGAFLYSGLWTRSFNLRALAASLFIGNGFFVSRLSHGHIDMIPFLTLPLVLWSLHSLGSVTIRSFLIRTLLLGALFSFVMDGAPAAALHYIPWIVIYAVTFAVATRSIKPLMLLLFSGAGGALIGSAYLLPMLVGQQEFPRITTDQFTNPLSLFLFLLLPITGKAIPAPAHGHEYSVFIGPILLWLIWRYRREIRMTLPTAVARPLMVTSIFSILFGMGSLHTLDVPVWLSPFDWFRSLPGFRSMGVTGRYWGFLALPLSMLAAMGLGFFLEDGKITRTKRIILSLVLILQLVFVVRAVVVNIGFSRPYEPISFTGLFSESGAKIDYVEVEKPLYQGKTITPVVGVVNAYNNGDYIHPEMNLGDQLIREVKLNGVPTDLRDHLDARFLTWNRVRIQSLAPYIPINPGDNPSGLIVLNQAWNQNWHSSVGAVVYQPSGNLSIELPLSALNGATIDLEFDDSSSRTGVRIALWSWAGWGAVLASLLLWRRRT